MGAVSGRSDVMDKVGDVMDKVGAVSELGKSSLSLNSDIHTFCNVLHIWSTQLILTYKTFLNFLTFLKLNLNKPNN